MPRLRSLLPALLLGAGLSLLPLQASFAAASAASAGSDPMYQADAPRAYSMVADLLIARPLLIAGTALGAAVFVVTLPFSALGGNVEEAGDALVIEPGREAFVRCLGCASGYQR